MFNLHLERNIEIAHKLKKHKGKCKNLHGHSLKVIVDINAEKLIEDGEQDGMILDFGIVKEIIDSLDHSYLNDFVDGEMPTAERVAKYLAESIAEECKTYNSSVYFVKVKVYETENQCVTYSLNLN